VRYFLSRRHPPATRILLVESGSRHVIERVAPVLGQMYGPGLGIDLVTCFPGMPAALESGASVYRVPDYRGREGRMRLLRTLRDGGYSWVGIVCSDEPILLKWKWVIAARLPAKVFLINENGDFFWLDWGNWRHIKRFIAYRAGLSGAGAVRSLGRAILFPFTLLYLLLYASVVHTRRRLRGVYR
jgi:hypothetical protein